MARAKQENIAWGNMKPQHKKKRATEGFVKGIFSIYSDVAQAFDDLRDKVAIEDAEGEQLDLIGTIVGQTRDVREGITLTYFGYEGQPNARGYSEAPYYSLGDPLLTAYLAPDPEYRRMLRAKIGLNNSHGTASDIASAVRGVYDAPISVRTVGGGVGEVWIGTIPSPSDPLSINPVRFIPAAAGVRFTALFFEAAGTFGYEGQPGAVGYGQGPYARTPESNIFEIG